MQFPESFIAATLLRRYKRFLADCELADGTQLTVHCPNTGSMRGCNEPGRPIWISKSDNAKRKYPHTWEIIEVQPKVLVGINTNRANALTQEAIQNGVISQLQGYTNLKAEVKLASGKSRIDFLLSDPEDESAQNCYVEVKNVTLSESPKVASFPDAVTERGTKHLNELIDLKQQGHRAVLVFCVQHTGVKKFGAAKDIDPVYAETLTKAKQNGVEVIAYRAKISPKQIALATEIPVVF